MRGGTQSRGGLAGRVSEALFDGTGYDVVTEDPATVCDDIHSAERILGKATGPPP